jgi:cytochrome P450
MTDAPPAELLLDPELIADPHPLYRRLHAEAPVWNVPGTGITVVSSFPLVMEATARVEDFSSNINALIYRDEQGLPVRMDFGQEAGVPTLATADPPTHTLHRRIVFPELVARQMNALEGDITDLATDCVAGALQAGAVDFMPTVANVIPITIVERLIGFRDSDPQRLLAAAFDSTALLGGTISLDELGGLVERIFSIEEWIGEQLDATSEPYEANILGAVKRGLVDGDLVTQEATVILHTLLSAGGESTTSLIGNAVRILAERPELQAQLRNEPELIPVFVEEAVRMESPFRYLMRSVPEQTRLGDTDIPAGTTVLLFWGAANRDPQEYKNADEVDLGRRTPRQHLAFGRGIHYCVGAPLARLEARVVLAELLKQTMDIRLNPDIPPRWVDSLQIRRHEELPLLLS